MHLIAPETPLRTPRLSLEPLCAEHAAVLYDALQDPSLYTYIPEDAPVSPEALAARYQRLSARRSPDGQEAWLNWAARRDASHDYIGTFQASVHVDTTASIAYMVFAPFQRQGYAREGCARMLDHLFGDYGVTLVAAELDTRNAASIALVESLGFSRVATTPNADFFKGTASDEHRYALRRCQHRARRQPPGFNPCG
jgi:RimJ/RimL family protein N-acetyltransferase